MMNTGNETIHMLITDQDEQLVRRTAKKLLAQHQGVNRRQLLEELYHYGMVGLVEAKRNFNREKGIPFPPFAVHRIRGAMIDFLRTAPMIRLPQKKQELRKQLEQARVDLRGQRLEESDQALAHQLGWSVEQVQQVAAMQTSLVSLSTPAGQGGEAETGEPDRDLPASTPGPEEKALKRELAAVVQDCLEKIKSSRDRLILIGRVFHERKLRELAEKLDCTVETVRLRQLKAMESMKRCLASHGWDEHSLPKGMG